MADIDIQKKQGPGVWPWVIGVAVLALVVWGVAQMFDTRDDRALVDDTTYVAPAAEPWTAEPPPPATMPTDPVAPGQPQTVPPAQDAGVGTGTTADTLNPGNPPRY
jgi:hypothetical protein